MTIELPLTHAENVIAIMEQFERFSKESPALAKEFLWRIHYSLNPVEAEVHHMTCWLYWWDVWPVEWPYLCDLVSGVLTDEQRRLRIGRPRYNVDFGGVLADAELPQPSAHRVVDR